MQYICCPECFGTDFTGNYDCVACQTSLLTGEKITVEQKRKNLLLTGQVLSVPKRKKVVKRSFKQKLLIAASCFTILLGLFGFAYQQSFFRKTKSLETVAAQLSAKNDLNKFAVEMNDEKTLTAITLTQENIKIAAESEPPANIKLIFDCVIEGNILTHTPDEYHFTIVSNNLELEDFEPTQIQIQTENNSLTFEKKSSKHWTNDNDSLDFVSHRISRKELEKIVDSKRISFQTGKYSGQMNFAQQQSLRSFLVATSLDSKLINP